MTYITDTTFMLQSARQDSTEDLREGQGYLDAREEAVTAMLATEPRVFGSMRLARLLGVTARLHREVSG